jgi:hypothetical protein
MATPERDPYPWAMVCPLALTSFQSGYVLAAITLFVLPVAATAFACSAGAWRDLGKGRFGIMHSMPPPRLVAPPAPPIDKEEQAAEARQMLEAKSYRRLQRGRPPIDIEAEMARLLEPEQSAKTNLDEKLRAEIRALVIARNERRMRGGKEPLDVEAETERQIADFIGLGN